MSRTPTLRLATLPLLLLPGYMVLSSLQACSVSTDTSDGGVHPTNGCASNETLKQVDGTPMCCVGNGGNDFLCHAQGAESVNAPCSTQGAATQGKGYDVTFDVCVKESCSGDRSCDEFATLAEETSGTLVCKASPSGGLTWQWRGDDTATHRVERACVVTSTEVCGGGIYDDPTYAYAERSYAPEYGYTCGYGDGMQVRHRELIVLSSTCAKNGAPSPCPVGSL